MMEQIYTCDICLEKKSKAQLMGCYFITYSTFELRDAKSTDGRHICIDCLKKLKEELAKINFA